MIAALYVARNGSYIDVPGVDPWPEDRDARLYRGPHPVVAHPPCQRWGKFWAGQPLFIKQTGIRKTKGDDGGCFERALWSARLYGGVVEHPCDSHAWAHFGLNKPPRSGGWVKADALGGWTCCVEQGRYGHYARIKDATSDLRLSGSTYICGETIRLTIRAQDGIKAASIRNMSAAAFERFAVGI